MQRRAIRQRPITTEPEPDVRDGRKNNKGNPNWHKGMTKPEGSGRKPGQGNRVTSNLKTALMMAAEAIGDAAPAVIRQTACHAPAAAYPWRLHGAAGGGDRREHQCPGRAGTLPAD